MVRTPARIVPDGQESPTIGVTKRGSGLVTLTGNNTYTGPTVVTVGNLTSTGSLSASNVTVTIPPDDQPPNNVAIFQGKGTVGKLNVGTEGTSSGGSSEIQPLQTASRRDSTVIVGLSTAILNTKDVTLAPGSFVEIELNGTTVGSKYDQLNVTGSVNLGGSTLVVSLGFTPRPGDRFTIINNDGTDPIVNTFLQGASISIGGTLLNINYAGGDGNDVVLIVPSTSGLTLPVLDGDASGQSPDFLWTSTFEEDDNRTRDQLVSSSKGPLVDPMASPNGSDTFLTPADPFALSNQGVLHPSFRVNQLGAVTVPDAVIDALFGNLELDEFLDPV